MPRSRSPRRPSLPVSAPVEIYHIESGFAQWLIDLPYLVYFIVVHQFALWVLNPLIEHYRWYSKWIVWITGTVPSCNFTAINLFAEAIGQPAHRVRDEIFRDDIVQSNLFAWKTKSAKQPLLISVLWSNKNRYKCHWLYYEKGFLIHSARFGPEITWHGQWDGFHVRKDPVMSRWTFQHVASHPTEYVTSDQRDRMCWDIMNIMSELPGFAHTFKPEKFKKKFVIQTIHRTCLPDEESVSLYLEPSPLTQA